jgi:SAM-dependent methyltransferase
VAPKKIICTDIKKPSYLIDEKKFNPILGKNIDFILEDVENKNVSDLITKKFDLVISTQVLEHIENCDKYFANLINSIKKNSYLFLTTPYWNSQDKITKELKKQEWEIHSHYHVGFDIEYFKKFEDNLGFRIVEYGPTGFFNQKMFHKSLVMSEKFLKNKKCDKIFINSIFYLQSLFHYQTLEGTNRSFEKPENFSHEHLFRFSDAIFLLIKKI